MVIMFDRYNLPENIYEIVFSTKQQALVGQALINYMKDNNNQLSKSQMSHFATSLHDGEFKTTSLIDDSKDRLAYNKRQFYDRILTPMKTMGIIDYDLYKKTYTLSASFEEELKKISQLWLMEMKKEVYPIGES